MLTGRWCGSILRDIGTVEQDAALVRRLEAGQHPQQRGLAAAAGPEQREKFAAPDIERQSVDRPQRSELLHHGINAEQRRIHRDRQGLRVDRQRLSLGWHDVGRRFGFRRIRLAHACRRVFRHDSSLPRRRQASGGTARTQPRARRATPNWLERLDLDLAEFHRTGVAFDALGVLEAETVLQCDLPRGEFCVLRAIDGLLPVQRHREG